MKNRSRVAAFNAWHAWEYRDQTKAWSIATEEQTPEGLEYLKADAACEALARAANTADKAHEPEATRLFLEADAALTERAKAFLVTREYRKANGGYN